MSGPPQFTPMLFLDQLYNTNNNHKKAKMATLISNTIDFMTKSTTTDEKEHFTMMKGQLIRRT